MIIHHLTHQDIDFSKWDKKILESNNFVPYALSWYLDIVSPNWEALVTDNYDMVMPLPVKKKWGLKYLIQPKWAQKLGVFHSRDIQENDLNSFIKAIPYKIYAFNLNEGNFSQNITKITRDNITLDLALPYDVLNASYCKNTKRNIKKADNHGVVLKNVDVNVFWEFWETASAKNIDIEHQILLHDIIKAAEQHNCAECCCAYSDNGDAIAALFSMKFENRIVYLAPVSNSVGFDKCAMFKIVDDIINRYADSCMVLDFEGSMIDGVARFYLGFGGQINKYYSIRRLYPRDILKFIMVR